MKKQTIPIFFSIDDNYAMYLAVTLNSIKRHIGKKYIYKCHILHTNLSKKYQTSLSKFSDDNFVVEFNNLTEPLQKVDLTGALLRDYYSISTYYRLFIPTLFPEYDKAIYLDSDVCLTGDIAEFFEIELGDNLAAVVQDNIIAAIPVFRKYAKKFMQKKYTNYFNAGVLLLNLAGLRKFNFEQKLLKLMSKFKFPLVQDQDYLNVILNGHTKMLSYRYNRMPFANKDFPIEESLIIHFNLNFKPWKGDILFDNIFWDNAKQTEFYDVILAGKNNMTAEEKEHEQQLYRNLMALGESEGKNKARRKELKKIIEEGL